MKITSVQVIECKPNVMGKVICVRINTDCKEIYGYGEVACPTARPTMPAWASPGISARSLWGWIP